MPKWKIILSNAQREPNIDSVKLRGRNFVFGGVWGGKHHNNIISIIYWICRTGKNVSPSLFVFRRARHDDIWVASKCLSCCWSTALTRSLAISLGFPSANSIENSFGPAHIWIEWKGAKRYEQQRASERIISRYIYYANFWSYSLVW